MTNNTAPTITVTALTGTTHQGRASRRPGMIVTACNGRTQTGTPGAPANPGKLCERCYR